MKVAILMGSPRDADKMAGASEMLERFDVPHEVHVMSAHRTPDQVADLATNARKNGYGAIICGAGMAAHLAGAVSAKTTLPVIGVPLSGGVAGGIDALLSTVQMPRGIPVATVAVDGSANAAVLAVEILSVSDSELAARLATFRDEGAR
ncbi:MAG: 5-(carboxyamino)imidazole ribonucleotide mutase [Actinomycetota bacterium]|mgnify:FL=1|nr:5-(carboxyamino)imidazole ribonucleotide mutase [Acidimicrobiales bacterium]MED5552568.1 5-(carboxyamino)imidazole ribonucleotide mutase [Actinomycetota bacterium]MEE2680403.1 5-(carboxyamino)imidazole ribonucleotide mutase [Actinomycetota bacterium]MEE3186592.1 5-(carboxyamino)imidazole ribonucleotide mutase [Actinomycetota bacterium]